jgi:hypothetical protein
MIRIRLPIILLAAGLCLLLCPPSWIYAQEKPLEKLMPIPGFSPEWVLDDPVKTYTRDDLFNYINGEAELYYPYGFERLASGFYAQKESNGQIGLAADIYKMGSLLDAFGIYAQYRKPEAQFVPFGAEGFINPSQLIFYQDRYFVQIAASGTSQIEPSILKTCALAISKALPTDKGKPRELDLLSIPSLVPQTERYYPEGLLGYAFFRQGLIASALRSEKKFRVFVLIEKSPESAGKILDHYARYVKDAWLNPTRTSDSEGSLLFSIDPLHKGLLLKQKGRFIVGVADLESPGQGTALIKQLLDRLPSS